MKKYLKELKTNRIKRIFKRASSRLTLARRYDRKYRKLGLKTKIIKRIEEIPKNEWDKVFPNVLESYDYFKCMEESGFNQFSFLYILVYDNKTLVGAVPCFLLNYSLDTSMNGSLRRISNVIKKFKPEIFSLKALACGMPLGQGRMGFTGEKDRIVKAVVRRMEQMAKKEKIPIIAFKDFSHAYTDTLDTLLKDGFARFDSLPCAEMDISFKNFDHYMETLSGASRYDLRRKFKKVDGHVKLDFEICEKLDDYALSEVYRLYLGMVDKHDMGFELVPKEFFRNVSKHMPGEAKFFLWWMDKKLVCFVFCLVSDDFLIDYYLGLDYEVAHKYHLYFVKFREVMKWCIEHNIKKYDMGITGYEAKKRLGFDFLSLYIYAKHRNILIRPFFNFFCQFLKFENFDPILKGIRHAGRLKK